MYEWLLDEIKSIVAGGTDRDFEDRIVALFRRQYDLNAAYRRYVDSLGVASESVSSWTEIPAVPALAFKHYDLTCVPTARCEAVFFSSGTTAENRSKHWMDDEALSLYETSLIAGYERALDGEKSSLPIWAIIPPPAEAPNSSLTHMLKTLDSERWYWQRWDELSEALGKLSEPITLFGTAFAFITLFDAFPGKSWPLPEGSVVINTGGFKGRTREAPRDRFYSDMRERFSVSDADCIGEYGMSEMASQYYSAGVGAFFKPPHWLRWRIIGPATGGDVEPGEIGVLRHYDLANWNSVCAIQTQDLARAEGDGFVLLGRATDAEVRGCSLTVEELWNQA